MPASLRPLAILSGPAERGNLRAFQLLSALFGAALGALVGTGAAAAAPSSSPSRLRRFFFLRSFFLEERCSAELLSLLLSRLRFFFLLSCRDE